MTPMSLGYNTDPEPGIDSATQVKEGAHCALEIA